MMYVLIFVITYLLGSLSGSIIISKSFHNEDIRSKGSGNAGTTNALRLYGKKFSFFVLAIDIIKTVLAILIAKYLDYTYGIYIAGTSVVIGHVWPIYYNFKGGKGVASSLAANFVIDYKIALIQLLFFVIINYTIGIVSLASIIISIVAVLAVIILNFNNIAFIIMLTINMLIIIYAHRKNIKKIINGEENVTNLVKALFINNKE